MPMWVFLVSVIGGILIFAVSYDWFDRRSKKRPKLPPGKYDHVYTEQLLHDSREQINRNELI